jgi:hypothetical protein
VLPLKYKDVRSLFRRRGLRFYGYGLNSASYAVADIRAAFRLISVDNVQVLLLSAPGTLASSDNLSLVGKDFKISLTKYLLPML